MPETADVALGLLKKRLAELATENDRLLNAGGGGGTSDGMAARVKRLEDDGKELRSDLKTIMRDLSEIKGRVNAMPTIWQMVSFVIALCVALFGHIRFGLGLGG